MNKISVYGRVASDVTTQSYNGRNVANFRVASNTHRKDGDKKDEQGRQVYITNFYNVSCWGNTADNAAKYLKKGNRIAVSGDLVIRPYTTQDGRNGTAVEIDTAEFDIVETRAEVGGASAPAAPAPQQFTPVEMGSELPF